MGKDKSLKRCSSTSFDASVQNKKAAGFGRRPLNKCSSSSLGLAEVNNNQYIFICASGTKSVFNDLSWYKIDACKNYCNESVSLPPVCTIPTPEIGSGCGTVALGSNIYMMGGYLTLGGYLTMGGYPHITPGSSYIFSFETKSSSSPLQWRKHSTQLLSKRGHPTLVAALGKIYIFGSTCPMPHPWAEVFDPESNTSSALPHPPSQISKLQNKTTCIYPAVVHRGECILLLIVSINDQFIISFNVLTNAWSNIHIPTHTHVELCSRWGQRAVAIDEMDVILTFSQGRVFAYEYSTGEWYPDPVSGLDIISTSALPECDLYRGQVVNHGNNVFSVVWEDFVCDDDLCESKKVFRCIHFKLTMINKSLQAHILAHSSYKIADGDKLHDCFPM